MERRNKAVEEQHKIAMGQCREMRSECDMLKPVGKPWFNRRDRFQGRQS